MKSNQENEQVIDIPQCQAVDCKDSALHVGLFCDKHWKMLSDGFQRFLLLNQENFEREKEWNEIARKSVGMILAKEKGLSNG